MIRRFQLIVIAAILLIAAFSTELDHLLYLVYLAILVVGGSYILTRLGLADLEAGYAVNQLTGHVGDRLQITYTLRNTSRLPKPWLEVHNPTTLPGGLPGRAIALGTRARRRRGHLRPAWRQPLAIVGAVIAVGWLVVAIFAPYIAPHDPLAQIFPPSQSPSGAHLFGTDELGRDVLSRVIAGSRVSVPIALLLVTLAALIGGLIGGIAGYFRGVADGVSMRVVDLFFAFPAIILAMVVAAVLGRGLRNAALAIVIVAWPSYARVVRGLVLSVGDSEYVESARLLGSTARRTLFRDVVPNVAGPVLVLATLDLANAILLLAGLSFLGLGAQPPHAEWGSMVADGAQYFQWWWIGTFPGLAIFTAVLAFNFLGDSLRDIFDPRTAWRSQDEE